MFDPWEFASEFNRKRKARKVLGEIESVMTTMELGWVQARTNPNTEPHDVDALIRAVTVVRDTFTTRIVMSGGYLAFPDRVSDINERLSWLLNDMLGKGTK